MCYFYAFTHEVGFNILFSLYIGCSYLNGGIMNTKWVYMVFYTLTVVATLSFAISCADKEDAKYLADPNDVEVISVNNSISSVGVLNDNVTVDSTREAG